MCRFIAYLGKPLLINDVISKPKDSLIKQSVHALESDVKLNGDGFGIGWYNPSVTNKPGVFVSILPAWNDLNLRNISHQIVSPCFFGHVRAAEEGSVTHDNCHPFHYKHYMFMHNGGIGGYKKIKQALFALLSEEAFLQIHGHTDSEAMFALWLTCFLKTKKTLADMLACWRETLKILEGLQAEYGVNQPSYINALVTDGEEISGVRYSTDPDYFLSLHFLAGREFVHTKEGCHMLPAKFGRNDAVIISSEIVTAHKNEWREVEKQAVFSVDRHKVISTESL
ncbi:MAG: class II glutamine amidotransferase [Gammaproteobacteria bacterium CG11_big_fil_rev_8_21_14_0_20_46_22]|nr:MAG: class II glutamine amidotransferase [Gammaproteobacteria bacterium CG12_big_fil_rev_8_21_14_0_65_46_12]PIR11128.1 MAG: class II glutamine amidotransferase [Gammaproteobacteria bacterium CG11_big_fil_rev_8_21_14_0_20_46_22]